MEFSALVFVFIILGSNNIVSGDKSIFGSLLDLNEEKQDSHNNSHSDGSSIDTPKVDGSGDLLSDSLKAISDGLEEHKTVDSQSILKFNHGYPVQNFRYPLKNLNMRNRINPLVQEKINKGNYQDKDVKLAAQKFPQLQALLDKLKELNRQKELQQHENDSTETDDSTITPVEDVNENTQGSKKMKSLKKKKFYFQAKPVRPENIKDNEEEIVYYED